MTDFDVAGIMPTVQKNALAAQTQARAAQQQKVQAATPPVGPTGFWARIGQVGVGQVNLLNATKAAKSIGVSTAQGVKGAATGIARTLPGGQNDLKAEAAQTTSANNATRQIIQKQKAGTISKPAAAKLLNLQAGNAAEGAKAVTKTANAEPTTKEFAGDLAQTALLAVPGAGEAKEAVTGTELLKTFGTQGVKDLADKAGIDIAGKGAIEGANAIAGHKIAQEAFQKATTTVAGRAAGSAAKGAVGFGTFGAAQEAGQGGSNKQILKAGVTSAAEGAAAGAAGSLIKTAVKTKLGKTPTIEKGTAPRDNTPSPVNTLGEKAKARTANLGKKAVTGRQVTPEASETKLLGPGSGKIQGKGFTASPTADATKVKMSARLNAINAKLNAVAQGKTSMAAEDIKALKAEKAEIYKQSQSATPTMPKATPKVSELGGSRVQNDTQTALEKAHNAGDTKTEAAMASKLKDPALAGKSTTTKSAGKIFMDAQKSGKPITMDEARTQAAKSGREVSGSALRTENEAVKANLTNEFEDKATYKSGSYKDEAAKAVQLTHDNPKRAMDIAMGRKPGNNILHTSAVYHAVKNKAIADGDTETLRQLVTSSRHTGVSQAAQKLGSEGYNATSDDPVEHMRAIAEARVAAVEKKTKTSVPKAINDTAKEIASHEKPVSKQSWAVFVESIKC